MLKKLHSLLSLRKPMVHSAGQPPVTRRHQWLKRIAVAMVVFLVAVSIIGFFVVPPIAKHYLVKVLGETLGRPVAIDAIELNPFSLVATVKGFTVKEPDGSAVFVSFGQLRADLQVESVFRLGPILREIILTDPYVHVVRNPDAVSYNFSDLIDKFSKPAAPPDKEPGEAARFSLNNIQVVNGRIEIDDRPKRALHTVRDINVAIPFLSSLPYRANDYVQPSLAALVNDAPFALHGRTKPFQDTLETSLDINIDKLNIPRYLEYLPADPGFRLRSGSLDTRLTLTFVRAMQRPPILWIKGSVELHDLAMTEPDGKPLLNLARLQVPITGINVTNSKYTFGAIAMERPEVFVRRNADGSLNWMSVAPKPSASQGTASRPKAPEPAAATEFTLTVPEFSIHGGKVRFADLVPAKPFRTDLTDIEAALRDFKLPQAEPAQAELAFGSGFGESVKYAGSLALSPLASEGSVLAQGIKLTRYLPYFEDRLRYRLEDGTVDLSARYAFNGKGGKNGQPDLKLAGVNVSLASLRLRKPDAKQDFLSVKSLQLTNATVDPGAQALTVDAFASSDGFLDIVREPDGVLNATRILAQPDVAHRAGQEPAAEPASQQATPWSVTLNRGALKKWTIALTDRVPADPVKLVASEVMLAFSNLTNQPQHKGQVELSAKLNETGTLAIGGPLSLNPISAELKIDLENFGLVPLQPLFADKINILLTSADLSVKGSARFALPPGSAPTAGFAGDVRLTQFASVDKAGSEDFLKWGTLHLGNIAYDHEPMQLGIEQVALSDFYSRIIIFPDGRLNLQDIAATPQTPPPPGETPVGTDPEKSAAQINPADPPAPANADPAPLPPIRIGRVTLQNGDVNFTDLFIKPNYSANLTDIGGSVIGLSSQLDTAADVDLRGRFARSAPLQIQGRINPLVKNLFLDIKAGVHDIELGPFSPYSGKFVGYAIEKGKMNFDVAYKIEDRKLSASNRIVLDQLTFGGKVESPQATKLPVMLAIALLKDRNGVIDVNLPISGSLDDPKFSVGGVIIKVLVNLITKAITAPFALIANLVGGGGGEELSYVEFEPGRDGLTSDGQGKLAVLKKGLADRPGLMLDVTPRADPAADREGLRRLRFDQQVKAEKLKDMVKQGAAVQSVDDVAVGAEEYEKYLRRAYKSAQFPKPRNAIGFVKDLPVDETEKLMLTHTQVSDDDLLKLANRRGQAAKDFLTQDSTVAPERIFLVAPRLEAPKADEKLKGSRVEFSLK